MVLELPDNSDYKISLIDTWNMKITPIEGRFRGRSLVPIKEIPYLAILVTAVND